MGEQVADLAPLTVRAAARLAALERRPELLVTAFEAAERGSARVFQEALGRSRAVAVGGVKPEALTEEQQLRAELRQADARVTKEIDQPAEKVNREAVERRLAEQKSAEEAINAFIARLEREAPQYAAMKYPKPCTLDEARAALADGEVALCYTLGSAGSALLVVQKKAGKDDVGLVVYKLPPAGEIAERVAALTQPRALEDVETARALGAEAYRVLLGPASEQIKGKDLVIVPGDALGRLPFEMLAEPADGTGGGRWLVERHRIRYAPSLTALHLIRRWEGTRGAPERSLWALGDPVYRGDDPRLTTQPAAADTGTEVVLAKLRGGTRRGFDRLPGTGEEVERLRGLMGAGPGDLLVGPAATEAAVKRASASGDLERYRFVHFACHGVLGQGQGVRPALVLAQAGDQQGEDGLLGLDEVAGLRLNADLVVLSACETGTGQVFRSEGVSGLARAFLFAGTRGVVCSLWEVADRETSDLMADLYTGLKAGQPAADALRGAQLKRIAAGEPPLHWAPFVLIGH
jgi:CHAT domain-containing protein